MQRKGANISLKGYDDIFSTEQSRAESQQERVQEIPLSELHPFEGHPFRVVDDEEMMKTAESVRDFGVLTPAIVRPDPDGGYEIVSGHRRHRASELAGKETMPAIVRDLDDDAAIILMVDANLQRETILPSERAFAYKMKLDAIKHQGERTDLTSAQLGQKLWAVNQVAEQSGDSRVQVQRYIRLTELIPELLDIQGALEELYDLCDPDYMVDMLVNYSEEFDDISPTLLARSFQKNAEMVCEYRVLSSAGDGIDYQGTVLLNSRAVRLLSYVEDTSGNEKVRTIQSKELWLAEDMTFYVVSCMSTITMDKEEAICLNEHRSVVTTVECEDDIFFDMGSLICELDDICLFELLADVDATIYEL